MEFFMLILTEIIEANRKKLNKGICVKRNNNTSNIIFSGLVNNIKLEQDKIIVEIIFPDESYTKPQCLDTSKYGYIFEIAEDDIHGLTNDRLSIVLTNDFTGDTITFIKDI